MTTMLSAADVHAALTDGGEVALIDVREQGAHSEGHPLVAVCIGLSRLDMQARRFIPRLDTRIIVLDGGSNADDSEDLALRAAKVLSGLGYTSVGVLDGGVAAWAAAGYEVFSGVNVPSKAFGEMIEHWHDTPRVSADELAAMQKNGENMVILDSRPPREFRNVSIPGGIDCPGAELVYRVDELASEPDKTIVVNCAGRTRSIIGAQSLINAGVPNRIVALKDGTMGWQLAGYEPASGCEDHAPVPGPKALATARRRAEAVAKRYGVESIDTAELAAWQADAARTTLILDVRTEQEYRDGHWPGARHAPGGQLVQATDEYVAVRGARLVLADSEDGVRATMTAHWLRQLGWQTVRVLTAAPPNPERGDAPEPPWPEQIARIGAEEVLARLAADEAIVLLDLGTSRRFLRTHAKQAYWAVRARLEVCRERLVQRGVAIAHVVFLAEDESLAAWAARDWLALGPGEANVLDGGLKAWQAAGGDVATGEPERLLTDADDTWLKPYERGGHGQQAMQDYLTWEVGLVDQLSRDRTLSYWQPDPI